jgi:hypothetical protein
LQPLTDEVAQLNASTDALAAAVLANTSTASVDHSADKSSFKK